MPIAFRLTRLQAELLTPGLRQIFISNTEHQLNGYARDCHPEAPRSCNARFGKSHPEFIVTMLNLWKQIQKVRTSGGRIYLNDPFSAAACIFALRVTLKKVRHGHHEAWAPDLEQSAKRFIKRLERERKRLKRAYIASHGKESYETKQLQWDSFVRFLHYFYVYCRCSYRPRNYLYRRRMRVIDQFLVWTREELMSREVPVPENLRVLVRRFLSYVRRDRTFYSIPLLLNDEFLAKSAFANYMLPRIPVPQGETL